MNVIACPRRNVERFESSPSHHIDVEPVRNQKLLYVGGTLNITKRNHYNPCFWTAHWNPDYFRCKADGNGQPGKARIQRVYTLNIKSGEIREDAVKNVHFEKDLGLAEITREAEEDFVQRHYPGTYEEFLQANKQAPYPIEIDFEDFFTGIEGLLPYQVLKEVVRRGSIQSAEEKTALACFIVFQNMRCHSIMNAMIEWNTELKRHKFEHFLTLRRLLSNAQALMRLVLPIVTCRWTLFNTASDMFPLCDSPVLIQPHSIMIALSPRLLLEIQPNVLESECQWQVCRTIEPSKLDEFRRRTIGNSFREIIFGDRSLLEMWQRTPEFQDRIELVRDVKNYNQLVQSEGSKELWHINAYGNRA